MAAASTPTTWVMVPIPEADLLVRAAWRRFSPDWPFGWMPESIVVAHVTVAGPFLALDRLDPEVVSEIREHCARQSAFRFTLCRVAAFSTGVVHLVPEPAGPFLDLMHWFANRWPEAPLYGGAYDGSPHVSVAAEQHSATRVAVVVAALEPALPIDLIARELRLVLAEDRIWHLLHSFAFGADAGPLVTAGVLDPAQPK